MPLTDYHKSILSLRAIPLKRTRAIEERLDTALRMAATQLDDLIMQSKRGNALDRQLFEARRMNLTSFINDLSVNLKREMMTATNEVAQQVAGVRQDETNQLLREQGLPLVVDFSEIPRQTLEFLAQRIDVEGLKVSSQIWAQNQIKSIENEVLSAIARGTSADELGRRLRVHLLGSDALTPQELADLRTVRGVERRKLGHSILYKAKRLARTEINNAYWESGRLSAQESPVVLGISWNLSNRHPKWDVCDILANQDLYGLGKGIYPPEALPPKPHPNDLCYQQDVLRAVEDWDKPKTPLPFQMDPEKIKGLRGEGTRGYNNRQKALAIELIKASHEVGTRLASARGANVGTTPEALTWQGKAKSLVQKGITTEVEARELGGILRLELTKRLEETGAKAVDPFASPARLIEDEKNLQQSKRLVKKIGSTLTASLDERLDETAKGITRYSKVLQALPKNLHTIPPSLHKIIRDGLNNTETIGSLTEKESKALIDKMEGHRAFLQELVDFKKQSRSKVQSDIVKDVLSEIREVGNNNETHRWGGDLFGKKDVPGGPKDLQKLVTAATELMPTSWNKASIQYGPLTVDKVHRAYYSHRPQQWVSDIRISGAGDQAFSNTIHEMGHRFDGTVGERPGESQTILGRLSQAFYERRTQGDSLVHMGAGYEKGEMTKPDKFVSPYIGKQYRGMNAWEILSMGLEGIYMNKYDLLRKDTDMADFILGLLGGI